MKKYLKDIVLVVVTAIIASGVGVAAYNYNANNIEYSPSDKTWKVSTVAEAINSLVNDTKGSVMNYSEEEQVVGTWIDGKPIYQKTLKNQSIVHGNNEFSISSLNIDTFVNAFANTKEYNGVSDKRVFPDDEHEFYIRDNVLKISSTPGGTFTGCNITLQYTKTTDTGNSNNS